MSERESWSSYFLRMAQMISSRGTCQRAKVGAVLTKDHHHLTDGYNGAPSGFAHCTEEGCLLFNGRCARCTHAEANAIAWAARKGISVAGTRMYSTLPPCLGCFILCVSAGVVSFAWPEDAQPRSHEEMVLIKNWSQQHGIELRTVRIGGERNE